MYSINFWPVLVASVVSFAIGALWYSPVLFGKEWMSLNKLTEADVAMAKAKGMWRSYIVHFVATLVSFMVMTFLVSSTTIETAGDGASLGFVIWLGFIVPMGVSELLWKKSPGKLVLIDQVNLLISLIIGGSIIGGWQ